MIYDPSLLQTITSQEQKVFLYPNPVKNEINFKGILNKTSYELYTIEGALIDKGNYSPSNSIKVSNLPVGIYLIKINGEIFKFLKN